MMPGSLRKLSLASVAYPHGCFANLVCHGNDEDVRAIGSNMSGLRSSWGQAPRCSN